MPGRVRTAIRSMTVPLLALCAWAPGAHAAIQPPQAQPSAVGYGGAAATVDPYATKAAIDVLEQGGNAVDATIAASAVLGVVEPYSAGIGGGGFMVVRTPRGRVETIDGRETAPAAFTETSFVDPATGQPIPFEEAVTSGLGVGVPGTLRQWQLVHRRHGSLPLRRLLRPAQRLARQGFVVDATLASQTVANAARFADFPATAELFLPGGQPLQAGAELANPDLADTYRLVGRRGVEAFYEGGVARDIVATVKQPPVRPGTARVVRPGVMETGDLAAYRAKRREPAASVFRGDVIVGMPPPSSGATTISEILNILEALGPDRYVSRVEYLHDYLEASRLAYADRNAFVGDPDFVEVPLDCLLSQSFANVRAPLIGPTAASSPVAAGTCAVGRERRSAASEEGPSTTNLTVADEDGMVVEYTFTIEQTGGSGIVVPGRGFLLNNELTDFTFTPGAANSPAPRKRPRSSMAPTIVLRNGQPKLAVGSPGGATIITTVTQVLLGKLDLGMSLPEAIDAPRISQRNSTATEAEQAFLDSPERAALERRGHQFRLPTGGEIGAATGILFGKRGKLTAAAESVRRGGGSAMVVRETRRGR
jgi:gamma-glutamyltranspeptidase/glutathione hydrolase